MSENFSLTRLDKSLSQIFYSATSLAENERPYDYNCEYDPTQPSLTELPDAIFEHIFKYLTFKEIVRLRTTCKYIYMICSREIRAGFREYKRRLFNQMELTRRQIEQRSNEQGSHDVLERAPFFRKYNLLEMLFAQYTILMIASRHIIHNESICFPGGFLLDELYYGLKNISRGVFDTWSVVGYSSSVLQTNTKQFLDSFREKSTFRLTDFVPMGVQVVDLLDIMLETDYSIQIIYDLDAAVCSITALYEQRTPKDDKFKNDILILYFPLFRFFLSYTPQICRRSKGNPVEETEMLELLGHLQTVVRIHNELLLRQEQYWREMDIVNLMISEQDSDSSIIFDNVLCRKPREYIDREPNQREFLLDNDGKMKIFETYEKTFGPRSRFPRLTCNIDMQCPISKAPLKVIRGWEKVRKMVSERTDFKPYWKPDQISISNTSLLSATSEPKYQASIEFHMSVPLGLAGEEVDMFELKYTE